ncbi:MAG: CpaF family protein [Lachnospiraceae bacterium]|nr:CpaF family protein [Lachnospiraceae bacterium]
MNQHTWNQVFFTSAATKQMTYGEILEDVKKYCTTHHSDKLTAEENPEEARKLLREFILQYIQTCSYALADMTSEQLCDAIYDDMAGISFLKKWIYKPGIEEVNVNAYNDIEVILSGGRSMKIPDRFQSPQHAIDVMRRLLSSCGMVIDDTMPSVIGYLDKNIRISVDKSPIVDPDIGINASIRIVNQQTVSREKLLLSGAATEEILEFLTCCIRYGVSVCIAGSTGSGKTTIMSWLLSMVPDNRRLITIEEGSREFDLIKRDANGHATNSVVHLLTRPHENPALNIDQDFLLERVLRKHPDVIGVGEMRSASEALSVAESSRTGHTVVTTIHSNSAPATYRRMMTLARRKYDMDEEILMQIMVEAYPVILFTKQLEDGSRRIMQVIESEDYMDGQLIYRTLFQYDITDNVTDSLGNATIIGSHKKLCGISESLKRRMLDNGIAASALYPFQ